MQCQLFFFEFFTTVSQGFKINLSKTEIIPFSKISRHSVFCLPNSRTSSSSSSTSYQKPEYRDSFSFFLSCITQSINKSQSTYLKNIAWLYSLSQAPLSLVRTYWNSLQCSLHFNAELPSTFLFIAARVIFTHEIDGSWSAMCLFQRFQSGKDV